MADPAPLHLHSQANPTAVSVLHEKILNPVAIAEECFTQVNALPRETQKKPVTMPTMKHVYVKLTIVSSGRDGIMISLPTWMPGFNEQRCLDFCFWRLAQ